MSYGNNSSTTLHGLKSDASQETMGNIPKICIACMLSLYHADITPINRCITPINPFKGTPAGTMACHCVCLAAAGLSVRQDCAIRTLLDALNDAPERQASLVPYMHLW